MKSPKYSLALILSCSLVPVAILGTRAQQDPGGVPPEVQAARQDTQQDAQVDPPQVQEAHQTPEQLQQLVAPIALYPDNLVGQILAASTYPAQVVEAERWMQKHKGLKDAALAKAVDPEPWDGSIKALTEFPKVLANMDKNLTWTSTLGDAYINQQQDVMNAIQVMRQRAKDSGNLQTNAQETVSNDGQTIVIQPANPQVVYVPEYDPWAIYGGPIAPYPYWAPYPGLFIAGPGIEFGVGFGFGFFGGFGWGWNRWGVDWHRHNVMYNHSGFVSHSSTFFNHGNFNGGRPGAGQFGGSRGASSTTRPSGFSTERSGALSHGTPSPNFGSGSRSSAFSGYDHGGTARGYSDRGQTSMGGGSRGGGSAGGGSRGGGGGGSRGGGGGGTHR